MFYRVLCEVHFDRKKIVFENRQGFGRTPPLFTVIPFLQKLTPETLPPLGAGGWVAGGGWLVAGGWWLGWLVRWLVNRFRLLLQQILLLLLLLPLLLPLLPRLPLPLLLLLNTGNREKCHRARASGTVFYRVSEHSVPQTP